MAKTRARFIEPMLLLRTEKLPQGTEWLYEIKLDGYRILAIKSEGRVQLRSRKDNDYTMIYKPITAALQSLPDETVIDGEVVGCSLATMSVCEHFLRDTDKLFCQGHYKSLNLRIEILDCGLRCVITDSA